MIENWNEFKIINYELERLIERTNTVPKVKNALRHVIKAGGKRTRPIIVLLTAKLCGGSYGDVMDMALAIELMHTASLVHDDIIDHGVMRRNVKALHVEYDVSLAILVGDWLISKSVELLSRYPNEIISDFARTGIMMSEGEVLDVYSPYDVFTEDEYFRCIRFKTASLFACGAKNSAMVVCDDEVAWSKMFDYGLNLGMAYQLVDDLLEYMNMYRDKTSKVESVTLPMIYESRYGETTVDAILEIIEDYAKKSRDALKYFEDCEARRKLEYLIDYMTFEMLSQNKNLCI